MTRDRTNDPAPRPATPDGPGLPQLGVHYACAPVETTESDAVRVAFDGVRREIVGR